MGGVLHGYPLGKATDQNADGDLHSTLPEGRRSLPGENIRVQDTVEVNPNLNLNLNPVSLGMIPPRKMIDKHAGRAGRDVHRGIEGGLI